MTEYKSLLVEGYSERALFFCLLGLLCDGRRNDTYFWEDRRVGERPFCALFPHLYYLSSLKNHLVIDFLVWPVSFCYFLSSYSRSLSDREATNVAALLSLLEGHTFRSGRRDIKFWSLDPLEGFSCKSFFHCFANPSPLRVSIFMVLWRIKNPRNVRFFTWQVLHNPANTLDQLVRTMPSLVFLLYSWSKGRGRLEPHIL